MRQLTIIFITGFAIAAWLLATRHPPARVNGQFLGPTDPAQFAKALLELSTPGPRTNQFVATFAGSPTTQLSRAYNAVVKKWHYVPDPEAEADYLASAEDFLLSQEGDCEDLSITLAAIARTLHVPGRFVITERDPKTKTPGHVSIEVLIASPSEDNTLALRIVIAEMGQAHLMADEQGLWLSLVSGGNYTELKKRRLVAF